jgi:transposase
MRARGPALATVRAPGEEQTRRPPLFPALRDQGGPGAAAPWEEATPSPIYKGRQCRRGGGTGGPPERGGRGLGHGRAPRRPRYEWPDVYAFARPATGETYGLLLPTVSGAAFSAALREFARDAGVGPARRVVLVLDGAGWHSGRAVAVPAGVHLVTLPPYSPERQPVERLWPLTDEALATQSFADSAALEEAQARRCLALRDHPEAVRPHLNFHWWPAA